MYVKGTPDIEITYKYNEEGIRVEKSIKDLSSSLITTTTYKVQGSKVIEETTGSNNIHYYYDINNSLIGFKHNNKNYYYEKSVLNDIIGIINDEGSEQVKYTYDAYGNITNIEDTSGINLSTINSYKYKDYYYDTESSYYYLNSRYYNPEVRRFINADDIDVLDLDQGTVLEHNLYAYTLNNPINMVDDDGYVAWWIAAAISGAIGGVISYGIEVALTGNFSWKKLGQSVFVGALSGVAFGGIGKVISKVATVVKAAKAVKYTTGTAGQIGRIGEKISGIIKNTQKFRINGRLRIPDGMTKKFVQEVKNVKSLSLTSQLKDSIDLAKHMGLKLELFIRPDTYLSGPLKQAIKQNGVIIRYLW